MSEKAVVRGCVGMFVAPFVGASLVAGYFAGSMLWDAHRMKRWIEVPATLESAELLRGDMGSQAYRASATYRYVFEGVEHRSDRVSLVYHFDNLGSFHSRVHAELEEALAASRTVPCYVDPEHPEEAILYRGARPELIGFYAAFALILMATSGGFFWYWTREPEPRRPLTSARGESVTGRAPGS